MFTKAVLPDTLRALQLITHIPPIQTAYLAGGTSLALQLGYRISHDLDFFTTHKFSEQEVKQQLLNVPEFISEQTAKWTVMGKILETKFSFFYYNYPLISPTVDFDGIQLAGTKDVAAMKINAVESRGTRRDFVDLFFLAKEYSFEHMLDFYNQKYKVLEDHLYSIIRAFDYFEDAEHETQMPQMLVAVEWEEVKSFFQSEAKRLAKSVLKL